VSVFLDTNVLLYADDRDNGEKTTAARSLIRRCALERTGVVSTQVLQEYYVNARKKLGMDGAAAKERVEAYLEFHVVAISPQLILAAIDLHRLDAVSLWDALVIRAAEAAGCATLYSEDLQNGRRFGGLRIVNPFV
jgi:predicted nucleic acid-binding protein